MNEIEQRIAIAEACGWRFHLDGSSYIPPNGTDWVWRGTKSLAECAPDYLHDLNAMHEAEKALSKKQQVFYLTKLLQVRYATGADHGMIACMADKLAFATAPQRVEAFLRTIGKWIE